MTAQSIEEKESYLTYQLALEINGLSKIYDDYLQTAFEKVTHELDTSQLDVNKIKRNACNACGLHYTP